LENLKQRNKEFTSFFSEFLGPGRGTRTGTNRPKWPLYDAQSRTKFVTNLLARICQRRWLGLSHCANESTKTCVQSEHSVPKTTIHDHDHDPRLEPCPPLDSRPQPAPLGPRPPRTLDTNPHNHDMSTTLWTSTPRVFGRTLRPDRTSEEIDSPRVRASDADNEATSNVTALFVSSRGYERIARRGLCCHPRPPDISEGESENEPSRE